MRKGETRNPNGRPVSKAKKTKSLTDQLVQESERKINVVVGGVRYRGTNRAVLARRMFERAVKRVEPKMCEAIFDRIDGKTISALELMGRNGEPVKLVVTYEPYQERD